jgi:hypothetical protein
MKNIGRYEIETYDVSINGVTETREKILYYNNNNEDFFIERYYGVIRDGYEQTEIIFDNLRWDDIKTNVVGESFYISDRGIPPTPYVYFTIADIDSIQRESLIQLKVIDSTNNPIVLLFETEFDCNQAYSLIILLLDDPKADTSTITVDSTGPVIYFNKLFYNVDVLDNNFQTGTFSSDIVTSLILNIETNTMGHGIPQFSGTLPITKSNLKDNLINKVSDNRDVSINIMDNDITINSGSPNGMEIHEISTTGTFFVKIEISDLVKNITQFTVLVNIT